ncbi:hypothetical protein OJ997_34115 [Solirubrobacter phytolaccae]|uniref:Uncharacterized protein n=1 Tax=Solirubrobacter phytolaccae TaxID=1404360 RepID=A0A9X3NHW2_9ACTN|nr:hypothetical protein [Solirubrobacter phytolaccae]MDA0185392.1 hypothetical protein [Solirubrobacter phytolaccae]
MPSVFALTDYQWLGIGGMVFGVLIIVNCRRIADLFAAFERAEADAVERVLPKRGREVISIWMRRGTGHDLESRLLRYSVTVFFGLIAFFVGLAALLGAWARP